MTENVKNMILCCLIYLNSYAIKLEISINFIDLIILYLTDSNIKVSNFTKSHMY